MINWKKQKGGKIDRKIDSIYVYVYIRFLKLF